jgi:hypothetical protein
MMVAEWDCETDVNVLTGQKVVRFRYRRTIGRGRWTSFVVYPDNGQTVDEIIDLGREIVDVHVEQFTRSEVT